LRRRRGAQNVSKSRGQVVQPSRVVLHMQKANVGIRAPYEPPARLTSITKESYEWRTGPKEGEKSWKT